jgi:hypothetical protein
MVLGIAVAAIISASLHWIQRLRLEEAKLRGGDPGDLNDIVPQMSALRHGLTDLQERLESAERMLAQVGEKPGRPAPPPL